MMTKATYGWTEGLLWVAGKPNHAKSTTVINLIIRALEYNPNLYILDFTLDDNLASRVSRYIAIKQNIDVNNLIREGFLHPDDLYTKGLIDEGYVWMSQFDKLSIYDVNWLVNHSSDRTGPTIQNICRYVTEALGRIKAADPNAEILIIIDAFNNLTTSQSCANEVVMQGMIAAELATLTRVLSCRILLTGHVLKHMQMGSATQDVMAGHRFLQYDAKGILLVYHQIKEDPNKTEARWMDPETRILLPVLSLRFAKNKMSSSNDFQFFGLYESSGKMVYLPEAQQSHYANILR